MEESKNSIPEKISQKTASLQKILKGPTSQITAKLKELKELLKHYPAKEYPNGIPLKEAAKRLGISEGGIKTIVSSTQNREVIKISPVQIGKLEEYYIKLILPKVVWQTTFFYTKKPHRYWQKSF